MPMRRCPDCLFRPVVDQWLIQNKVSARAFAQEIDLPTSRIYDWLNGRREITTGTLNRIMRHMGARIVIECKNLSAQDTPRKKSARLRRRPR